MGFLTSVYGGVSAAPASERVSVFDRPELFGDQLVPYKGRVILVVNTASKCGFARQYDALEALHKRYEARGLVVLGFPSNDFLGQEPGSDSEIESVCRINHGVTFPLLPKAAVKGIEKQPLFTFLTEHGPRDLRGSVRWNFEKFLVDREGYLVGRWRSYVKPEAQSIVKAIENALSKG
jgi:glutathione peroxidase